MNENGKTENETAREIQTSCKYNDTDIQKLLSEQFEKCKNPIYVKYGLYRDVLHDGYIDVKADFGMVKSEIARALNYHPATELFFKAISQRLWECGPKEIMNTIKRYGEIGLPANLSYDEIYRLWVCDCEYISSDEILMMQMCESPIERLLLHCVFDTLHMSRFGWIMTLPEFITKEDRSYIFDIFPQHEIKTISDSCFIRKYRVDFLLDIKINVLGDVHHIPLIIECDGHDFHEKTKEQAARDKKRDRDLISIGYDVLHFTGSEIWRDPMQCAMEIGYFINGQYNKMINDRQEIG